MAGILTLAFTGLPALSSVCPAPGTQFITVSFTDGRSFNAPMTTTTTLGVAPSGNGVWNYLVSGLTPAEFSGYSTWSKAWTPAWSGVAWSDGSAVTNWSVLPVGALQTGPGTPPTTFIVSIVGGDCAGTSTTTSTSPLPVSTGTTAQTTTTTTQAAAPPSGSNPMGWLGVVFLAASGFAYAFGGRLEKEES